MTALLPCPFCGGEKIIGPSSSTVSLDMNPPLIITGPGCARCGALVARQYATRQEAVDAWNKRTAATDAYALWCRPEDFDLPQLCGIALSLEDANGWKAESEAESANGRVAVAYFWSKSEVYRPTKSQPAETP